MGTDIKGAITLTETKDTLGNLYKVLKFYYLWIFSSSPPLAKLTPQES